MEVLGWIDGGRNCTQEVPREEVGESGTSEAIAISRLRTEPFADNAWAKPANRSVPALNHVVNDRVGRPALQGYYVRPC